MYLLPLNVLVEDYCRCESLRIPLATGEGHFELPIDLQHRFGVFADEEDGELLFFAHPGPDEPRDDGVQHEDDESFEDLAIGSDECGSWWLRINDEHAPKHTLFLRVQHAGVGQVEFAQVVAGMKERFAVWAEVLSVSEACAA
jgi:hypothetical protein